MIQKFDFIFTIALCALSLSGKSQAWTRLDDFPSDARDDGSVFVIGDFAYCGTGVADFGVHFYDFYKLNMQSGQWSQVASMPVGTERQYASGFSSDSVGFIFGGIQGSNYFNDVWKYNPANDVWVQMTSLPDDGRSGSCSFVIGDTAYVVGGISDSSKGLKQVWAYNMIADTWKRKKDLPNEGKWRASSTSIGDKGYLIFGKNALGGFSNQLLQFDPIADSWLEINRFPTHGRVYSAMINIRDELVVMAGIDSFNLSHNDIWKYNPAEIQWKQLNGLPAEGRRGGMCFTDGFSVFYSTGKDLNGKRLTETWVKRSLTDIEEIKLELDFLIYPNPAEDFIDVSLWRHPFDSTYNYYIVDCLGKKIRQGKLTTNSTRLDISKLESGLYYFSVLSDSKPLVKKLIVK